MKHMNKVNELRMGCSDYKIYEFSFQDSFKMDLAIQLRMKVFVQEQSVPVDMEVDGDDPEAKHLLLLKDDQPLGTCRWRETDEGLKLERFAIIKTCRGQGLGKVLVEYVLEKYKESDSCIYLYAQSDVIAFYEKFGFLAVGEEFEEAGIQHRKMIYQRNYGKQC